MKFIDPHIHCVSRTTDDYQAMAAAGILAIVEPAFWLGQPRTTVGSFKSTSEYSQETALVSAVEVVRRVAPGAPNLLALATP